MTTATLDARAIESEFLTKLVSLIGKEHEMGTVEYEEYDRRPDGTRKVAYDADGRPLVDDDGRPVYRKITRTVREIVRHGYVLTSDSITWLSAKGIARCIVIDRTRRGLYKVIVNRRGGASDFEQAGTMLGLADRYAYGEARRKELSKDLPKFEPGAAITPKAVEERQEAERRIHEQVMAEIEQKAQFFFNAGDHFTGIRLALVVTADELMDTASWLMKTIEAVDVGKQPPKNPAIEKLSLDGGFSFTKDAMAAFLDEVSRSEIESLL